MGAHEYVRTACLHIGPGTTLLATATAAAARSRTTHVRTTRTSSYVRTSSYKYKLVRAVRARTSSRTSLYYSSTTCTSSYKYVRVRTYELVRAPVGFGRIIANYQYTF